MKTNKNVLIIKGIILYLPNSNNIDFNMFKLEEKRYEVFKFT